MRDPIVFYVWRESPGLEPTVYTERFFTDSGVEPDKAIAAANGRLTRHTVTLKDGYTWANQCAVERLAALDETQRWPAMIQEYCAGWSLLEPCTMNGFVGLPPNLADKIGALVNARIFPDGRSGENRDFFTLIRSLQPGEPGKPSTEKPSELST